MQRIALTGWLAWVLLLAASAAADAPSLLAFESGQVGPLTMSPDGTLLSRRGSPRQERSGFARSR